MSTTKSPSQTKNPPPKSDLKETENWHYPTEGTRQKQVWFNHANYDFFQTEAYESLVWFDFYCNFIILTDKTLSQTHAVGS